MKTKLSKIIMLVGTMFVSTGIIAQSAYGDSVINRDMLFIAGIDPFLSAGNSAALTRYDSENISMAEVYGLWQRGGFVNYNESHRITDFGARVESFYRLSSRLVGYGKMSYGSFTGHEMTGSAFISPERKPFDIVEDSTVNAGKKHVDSYKLTGALGWDIYKGMSVGGRVDFTAANMEKYKDLRHKTKYMNLKAAVGIYVPLGRFINFGADYFYRRNTESVQFSTYGRTDRTYVSFINYGPWIGETEQFGDNGFTDKSRELPMLSEYNGFEAQLEVSVLPNLSLYNSFDMSYRKGYYGRKSPYTITFSNHNSHSYGYSSRLQLRLKRQIHYLEFSISTENLVNNMNTYRNSTNDVGATYYEYFDPVKSGNRLWVDTHADYTAYLGINNELPEWMFSIGADFKHRKQTGYDYPFYRRQKISSTKGYMRAERNWCLKRQDVLSIRLGISYMKGSGEPFADGTFIEPSDKQNGFPTMEAFLFREYYYLTAPQYNVDGGVRYSFLFPNTHLKTYVDIAMSHTKGNVHDEWLTGRDRTALIVTLGCNF